MARRNIIGECVIVTEVISKETDTKNVRTQKITRKTTRAIVLDCGHKIDLTIFTKAPKFNTWCRECKTIE